MKIEAVDDSEIEMIELNESEPETIETMVPGRSSSIIASASENFNSSKYWHWYLCFDIWVLEIHFLEKSVKMAFLS